MRTRLIPALFALFALVGVACSGGGDEATIRTDADVGAAGFLSGAVDRTSAESFNYSMTMDVDIAFGAMMQANEEDIPFSTGTVDGNRSSVEMDMGALMSAFSGGVDIGAMLGIDLDDLGMDMVTDLDEKAVYLRAPGFGPLLALQPQPGLDIFTTLGDGWGRADLTGEAFANPADLTTALGLGGGAGFEPMLEMVRNGADATEIGTETIRGVEATGVTANITFDELLAASGQSTDQLGVQPGLSDADLDAMLDGLSNIVVPMTVWLDGENRIVRLEVTMDMSPMFEALDTTGELDGFEMSFGYTIDAFDFGAPAAIEIPTEFVDVTAEFEAMLATVQG